MIINSKKVLINAIQKATSNEVIDKPSQNMMLGALKISSLDVSDIMLSHSKIESVDLSMTTDEILEKIVLSAHTRFPVYCADKTEIIGILHVKDLLKLMFSTQDQAKEQSPLSLEDIKKILRPAIFIPETKKLNLMLKDFKNSQNFINKVGDIAEKEGHHPDIWFGWGYAKIKIFTHAIKGLAESDFILAAKIDKIISA